VSWIESQGPDATRCSSRRRPATAEASAIIGVATIEGTSGWLGEWLERFDYLYKYMRHTSRMKRPASEYFARNIWISADPEERMLRLMVQFTGDDKFFIGSDYPHAEGFAGPAAMV
jgi:hypothetical protein